MRWRPRSVRVRLTLYYAGIVAAMVLAFCLGVYVLVHVVLAEEVSQDLARRSAAVETVLRVEPDEIEELEETGAVGLFCITRGERIVYRSMPWGGARLPVDLHVQPHWFEVSVSPREGTGVEGGAAIFFVLAREVRIEEETYRVLVARDGTLVHDSLATLAGILAVGVPSALLLAIVGGYLLARRLLAPIGTMARKARQISAESLSERLPVEDPRDELGHLATAFNDTLDRLQDAFERLRRFTADASHELRTPLTTLRSVGEVGIARGRDPESYPDVIGSMLEEAGRLERLVDGLLTLTRIEAGSGDGRHEARRVDLGAAARDAVDCVRVLAEDKRQRLELEVRDGVVVDADPTAIRTILMNLLDNAIKYSPPETAIRVVVRPGAEGAICEVIDQGPGIPEMHREKIFERFFRGGRSGADPSEGSGLGLAIALQMALNQGGEITLHSTPGEGATFRLLLPTPGTNPLPPKRT